MASGPVSRFDTYFAMLFFSFYWGVWRVAYWRLETVIIHHGMKGKKWRDFKMLGGEWAQGY